MLNRLTQPWLVYTELALSAVVILLGLGMRAWGNEPHSPEAGLLVVWIGVGCLVLSLVLWSAMMWRRRPGRAAS